MYPCEAKPYPNLRLADDDFEITQSGLRATEIFLSSSINGTALSGGNLKLLVRLAHI